MESKMQKIGTEVEVKDKLIAELEGQEVQGELGGSKMPLNGSYNVPVTEKEEKQYD